MRNPRTIAEKYVPTMETGNGCLFYRNCASLSVYLVHADNSCHCGQRPRHGTSHGLLSHRRDPLVPNDDAAKVQSSGEESYRQSFVQGGAGVKPKKSLFSTRPDLLGRPKPRGPRVPRQTLSRYCQNLSRRPRENARKSIVDLLSRGG